MERIVPLIGSEELIYFTYLNSIQGLTPRIDSFIELRQFASSIVLSQSSDAVYAAYIGIMSDPNTDPVSMLLHDLIFVFKYLRMFYTGNPFVTQLISQSMCNGRKIKAGRLDTDGLKITIT
jgi:hypothetical protein